MAPTCIAIVAYGFGGYLAARLRIRNAGRIPAEIEFRDGVHGLLAWALATLIMVLIVVTAMPSLSRVAAPSSSASGQSIGGESIIPDDGLKAKSTMRVPKPAVFC